MILFLAKAAGSEEKAPTGWGHRNQLYPLLVYQRSNFAGWWLDGGCRKPGAEIEFAGRQGLQQIGSPVCIQFDYRIYYWL
jgi:hypothetical protein